MAETILNDAIASNLFDLTGVIAVVTGGGSGIGLMISSALVANGATVYIIGPKQQDLDNIANTYNDAAEKASLKGRMYGLEGDIRLKSEAKRLASEVSRREKHVTVLFNNAGIIGGSVNKPTVITASAYVKAFFDEITQDDFNDVINTNSVGPYWLTFAFLPLLEKWKSEDNVLSKKFVPQVIMTSSMNGWTKDSDTGGASYPYLFSKSAIGHATASLAHELIPLGIRVNGIAPGFFPSMMTTSNQTPDSAGMNHFTADIRPPFQIPWERRGTPKDIGSLALFLVSNWFVNGETVLIDGGTMLLHPSSY